MVVDEDEDEVVVGRMKVQMADQVIGRTEVPIARMTRSIPVQVTMVKVHRMGMEMSGEEAVDTTTVQGVINNPHGYPIKLHHRNSMAVMATLLRITVVITPEEVVLRPEVVRRPVMEAMEPMEVVVTPVGMRTQIKLMEEGLSKVVDTVAMVAMGLEAEVMEVIPLQTMHSRTKDTAEEVPHTLHPVDEEGAGNHIIIYIVIFKLYKSKLKHSLISIRDDCSAKVRESNVPKISNSGVKPKNTSSEFLCMYSIFNYQ